MSEPLLVIEGKDNCRDKDDCLSIYRRRYALSFQMNEGEQHIEVLFNKKAMKELYSMLGTWIGVDAS
jgi:hypothetical protein